MKDLKVIAVTVTYNRKDLLLECVDSLSSQSYKLNNIIIIDNNSTDGTFDALKEKGYIDNNQIIYKKLEENIGGAGGFYEGMKLAREMNADWIWIMDDDTIPREDSLEELIRALDVIEDDKIGFLASAVYGTNNRCMNVPTINRELEDNNYEGWHKYLGSGIIKIIEATFVSLLINADVTKKIGLPCKEYFIWGDDREYTLRIHKYYGNAYMVGKSIVIHKRKAGGKAVSLKDEDDLNRINMSYYRIRNCYMNLAEYEKFYKRIKYIGGRHRDVIVILFSRSKYKIKKIKAILSGLYSGIFGLHSNKFFKNRLNT